jgi:hypothetical protein
MSLPYRQQHRLRQIAQTLHASDAHLSAMLTTFAALNAGEQMPAGERIRHRLPRTVRALARAAWAIACLAGRAVMACGRAVRRAAGRGFAAYRSAVSGPRHSALSPPARHQENNQPWG